MSKAFELYDEISKTLIAAKSIVTVTSSLTAQGHIPEEATAISLDHASDLICKAEEKIEKLYKNASQ